jgi:hypothetical protein
MKTEESNKSQKKKYVAPKLEELSLEGEEMAAVSCKTMTSNTGPAVGCLETACRDIGS